MKTYNNMKNQQEKFTIMYYLQDGSMESIELDDCEIHDKIFSIVREKFSDDVEYVMSKNTYELISKDFDIKELEQCDSQIVIEDIKNKEIVIRIKKYDREREKELLHIIFVFDEPQIETDEGIERWYFCPENWR